MRRLACIALVAVLTGGCGGDPAARPTPTPTTAEPVPTQSTTAAPTLTPSPTPKPGTSPPAWLGKRVLPKTSAGFGEIRPTPPELRDRRFTLPDTTPMLPGSGFASRTDPVPAEVLSRSTWVPGCPVGADDLRWVRLTFWGFDGARHTGELLTNKAAADKLVEVFRRLYAARFPIEEMRITRRDELDAPPTGDGNNTGSFNCRPAVGQKVFSQHAYGLAIDINPFQNPYEKGDLVLPELASAYRDRGWHRPGMITPDGPVTDAFAAIGWGWGGAWHSSKDLQHFSANGR